MSAAALHRCAAQLGFARRRLLAAQALSPLDFEEVVAPLDAALRAFGGRLRPAGAMRSADGAPAGQGRGALPERGAASWAGAARPEVQGLMGRLAALGRRGPRAQRERGADELRVYSINYADEAGVARKQRAADAGAPLSSRRRRR